MNMFLQHHRGGYTIVELMTTIVIVAVLAATVGMFFVKLLNIQEQDREAAYIREKLADICGAYADALSVGCKISTNTEATVVGYRQETGGVSLETGVATRVAYMTSSTNTMAGFMDLNVYALDLGQLRTKLSRKVSGDASLIPKMGDLVSLSLTPLVANGSSLSFQDENIVCFTNMLRNVQFRKSDTALGYLTAKATYRVKNDSGEDETKSVVAGRVVRLWNWK